MSQIDALKAAFTQKTTKPLVIKAEDIQLEGGMDYSKHFFDPQVGKTYTLKFLKNLEGDNVVHRKIYKNLPDPTRKGKTFQVVSSGSAKTCSTLELFFDLNNLKKAGDALAVQKLDKYMGVTNQGAALVQIINSPDVADIGKVRIFVFSTFGPNATVANLLNLKLNPTKEKIAAGFEPEDIFNLFESSTMILQCEEATYEGRKGRDFSKSEWAPKKRGGFSEIEGKIHAFSNADLVDGDFTETALPFFMKMVEYLQNPDVSIHNLFAFKVKGDALNTEDTEKYLADVEKKVAEIIPVIKDAKSLTEIESYGVAGASSSTEGNDSAKIIGGQSAADILKDSAPSELMNSVLGTESVANPATSKSVTDILNG